MGPGGLRMGFGWAPPASSHRSIPFEGRTAGPASLGTYGVFILSLQCSFFILGRVIHIDVRSTGVRSTGVRSTGVCSTGI